MSDSAPADDVVEAKLTGTTRRVYACFLESPDVESGVRDIARKLGIRHPSVVLYHLQKLEELGLLDHTNIGTYYLVKEVKVGVLRMFVRLRGRLFPRLFFYSLLVSAMITVYLCFYTPWMLTLASQLPPGVLVMYVTSLLISIIAGTFLFLETIMIWREK